MMSFRQITDFSIALDKLLESEAHMFRPALLVLLEELFGITRAGVIVHSKNRYLQTFSHNLSEDTDDAYDRYYHRYDIIAMYIEKNWQRIYKGQELVLTSRVIPADQYDDSEYVHFLNGTGTHYLLVMVFEGFYLALHRSKEEGDFGKDDLEVLSDIYKLLRHKYDQYRKNQRQAALFTMESDTLNAHKTGALIFDETGRLLHANEYAKKYIEGLLGSFDGENVYDQLNDRYADQIKSKDAEFTAEGYHFISQYFNDEDYYGHTQRLTAVTIIREEGREFLPSQISCMKELTEREMEVVDAVSKGMHYKEAAEALSISVNTVRTHLKHIHQKLDIKNQRKLVRLYMEYQLYGDKD